MNELKEQIRVVHEARLHAVISQETVNKLREKWESDNALVITTSKEAPIQQRAAEEELRRLTLEAYEETQNKALAPGVGIRETTILKYDPVEAFGWAVTHEIALTLDKKAFEKIALTNPRSMIEIDLVKITKEPQATIATDLTDAIAELEGAK